MNRSIETYSGDGYTSFDMKYEKHSGDGYTSLNLGYQIYSGDGYSSFKSYFLVMVTLV